MNKFNHLLKTITLIIFFILTLFFWQEKVFKTQTKAQIPGWSYRKKITINETKISGSGSLVNFPILVNITDSDLASKAQVNGNDILFTASDGTTKLNHEIEKFTKSTGQLIAWVNIPSLSATVDTDIYMYYENASAANQQNTAGTWNSNYNGVWHLSETGGIRYDSTGNNNLTDVNTVGSATGKVDGAANFVSSNSEELTITDASQIGLEPTGQMTFQAWVKAGTTAQTQGIITKSDLNTFGYRMRPNSSGWIDCTVFNGSNSAGAKTNLNPFTNSWNLIHCVYDGNYVRNYENGVNNNSNAYSAGIGTGANDFEIGTRGSQYFNGDLDEVRIINSSLSSAWIEAEYNNMSFPSTFYVVGIEESVVSATPTGTPTPTDTVIPDLDAENSIYSYSGSGYYSLDPNFDGSRTIQDDVTVFLISGTLEITENFVLTNPNDVVAFIVNGNIQIDGSVTELAGLYISSQTISFASSNQPITINGMMYAKKFNLGRTYADPALPAYQFIYQPQYLIRLLPYLGRARINWQDLTP